jgi:hypothetical protein
MLTKKLSRLLVLCLFISTCLAGYAGDITSAEILKRLERLEASQEELKQQLKIKDQKIQQLENEKNALAAQQSSVVVDKKSEMTAAQKSAEEKIAKKDQSGYFIPGKGFRLADSDIGSLTFTAYTYARYLNQEGLDDSYVDAFGRTKNLDIRNDLQMQKALLYFKGWLYDPNLNYLLYTWTTNTSQGDPAQVVSAGYMSYHFDDAFTLGAGIYGLPSVRSMEGQWPGMLKVDSRTIADEYFRGSYTSGIFAMGTLAEGLQYKTMLGNNLSQLGVSATELDDNIDTFSTALWWMPTTGEFGKGQTFGDFEEHENLATRLGVHYTHSTETSQNQPGKDDPENTQIRLSDGTGVFAIDAFANGSQIEEARYQMASLDAGLKYQGFALEGEYYWRWVDQFQVVGSLPADVADDLYDYGFQLQASMMVIPKTLQLYLSGSKIYGEYGDPSDIALGLNWFPLRDNSRVRINSEFLYLNDSPVGYSSVPFAVGGNGMVFNSNIELSF